MLWKDYEIDWLRSQNLTEIVVFFDQSKNNRNHEKLKVDFHCRVILRTSFTAWILLLILLFVCDGWRLRKLRVEPHSTFSTDASRPYTFSIYFLFCFVLDAIFTCIETDEMHVWQTFVKQAQARAKTPRLDLKSEVKM